MPYRNAPISRSRVDHTAWSPLTKVIQCVPRRRLPLGNHTPMADYYTILAKAVDALDPNTGTALRQLYQRARVAIVAKMEKAMPPFHGSDVAAAKVALESAIATRRRQPAGDRSRRQDCQPVEPVERDIRCARAGTRDSLNCSNVPRTKRAAISRILPRSWREAETNSTPG
jgi:hypothetical protein